MVDLHVHSNASDGTLSPGELAVQGRAFGLMALTDHDTTDGLPAFFAACAREGEAVRLGGIELSVASAPGYGRFHLLGLGIDPHNARLRAFLETIRCERDARNEKIIANLAAQGYVLSPDEVKRDRKSVV